MPNWNSREERECRARMEALKTRLHKGAEAVTHPCLRIREENLEIARANIKRHDWAKRLHDGMVALGDHYADRSAAWIETMIPDQSALHVYGAFCPVCEGDNTYTTIWDYRDPERLVCTHCKAVMTDQRFPEEGRLTLPRSGQTFTYAFRTGEKGNPAFSTGRHAFAWAGRKVHISPSSSTRHKKIMHMTGVARTLAILFRMTGQDRYGRTAAAILKRFAQVYPHYILRDYWDTAMDCDPLYACELVTRDEGVGKHEVNACPDQPGRSMLKSGKLLHAFWGAGRMACGGFDSEVSSLIPLTEALDLLWDAQDSRGIPFLTKPERETVTRDLVAEGLLTVTHWEGINNKVVACRVGEVALGRFLGASHYVHRGVEAFEPYMRGYFKFDGSSAEGASYYAYTLHNLWLLPEFARGYTDPANYRKKDRYDGLDLYAPGGLYHRILRARTLMTLPDGRIPHTADALEGYAGWPRPEWLHTMAAVRLGREFIPFVHLKGGDDFALFNRPASTKGTEPLPVRDLFFPGWMQAIFNTGYGQMLQEDLTGTATFLMNFYRPETHNHDDALNIAMFVEGVEVLSDLGYIGDHPLNDSLRSTSKHNLVLVDQKGQLKRGERPSGSVRLIATSPRTKVIEAECRAYHEVETYCRCCLMVHRGRGPAYVVDCFRVKGGKTHDYAIHGEGAISAPPALADGRPIPLSRRQGKIYEDVEKLRVGSPSGQPWTVAWTERPFGEVREVPVSVAIHGPLKPGPADGAPRMSETMTMRLHVLSRSEEVIVGDGPGQRSHPEVGARHDYLYVRNREQGQGNTFVTVIDHSREAPDVTGVRALALPDGAEGPVALKVSRRTGEDLVLQTSDDAEQVCEDVTFAGRAAVYSREQDSRLSLFLAEASRFVSPDLSVTLARALIEGTIVSSDASGFVSGAKVPDGAGLSGSFVEVEDAEQGCWTAYTIKAVRGKRVEVDLFPFHGGTRFRIPSVFVLEQEGEDAFRIRTTTAAEVKLRTDRFSKAGYERGEKEGGEVEARVENGCLILRIDPTVLKGKEGRLRLR
ncbi:MAG: hypothetical protein EXS64_07865 [Candidatus Latescibacteria bacterium]|nr:hypothetical protein [Candidatus Latescibacterota bacterium]